MSSLCTAKVASSQRIWVDDLYLDQRGSSAAIIHDLVEGVTLVRGELHQQELTLAPKSVVLC
eukprot:8545043-Pyramimonas_sp.AAC.1